MIEALSEAFGGHDGELGLAAMGLRLVLAACFGAVLGYERELRERPAGLRTHILVTLASAIFALIAVELVRMYGGAETTRLDPIRLVEAITSGVAFLAAGFIFFDDEKVRGVTTGAGMWLASAIGLATGLGLWRLAVLGCLLGVVVLSTLRRLEKRLGTRV